MLDLNQIRQEIDDIDNQILSLYQKRMEKAKEVAEYKIHIGKPVLDKEREKQKIEALTNQASNEFHRHGIEGLFSQLMAISRKLQYQILQKNGILEPVSFQQVPSVKIENQKVRVVFQGVEGAYSQVAMKKYFGEQVISCHVATWAEAMELVQEEKVDFAVLPIENSTSGFVGDIYDLLTEYDNVIVGEVYIKVSHALLGVAGATKESIKTVYSHPQGFLQCSEYLKQHKNWNIVSQLNTAISAKKVLEDNQISQGAIASEFAAKTYGLTIIEKEINDDKSNTTRFVIITKNKIYEEHANRVSIYFEVEHESGSLYSILSHFMFHHINITKIQSRPIKNKPFEYGFFLDFEGNLNDSFVNNVLQGVKEEVIKFKILGNY